MSTVCNKIKKQVEIVDYNPEWPKVFEEESKKIRAALRDNFISMHHVGSTAVPGLAAKAQIDIIIEVHDPKKPLIS